MKKSLIFLGVGILSVSAYFLLRKREVRFYDNIWCRDSSCKDFNTQEKVDRFMRGAEPRTAATYDSGMLTLLFEEPHKLIKDQEVLIGQDDGSKYGAYDGIATIVKVPNDFTIVLNKPRMGNSPVNGGYVYAKGIINDFI